MESRKAKRKAAARQQKSSTMQKTLVIGSVGLGVGVGLVATTTDAQAAQREWQANTPQQIKIVDGEGKYQVQWGDTLWAISQATGIPIDTLMQTNQIMDRDAIFEGNTLTFSEDGKQITVTNEEGEKLVDVTVNDEGTVEVVEPTVEEVPAAEQTAAETPAAVEHETTLLVRHVNEAGQEIAQAETIVGISGQTLTVEPKEIDGYAPVDEPQAVVLEGNEEQTIVYKKAAAIAVDQETPAKEPDQSEQPAANLETKTNDTITEVEIPTISTDDTIVESNEVPEPAAETVTIPVTYVEADTGQVIKQQATVTGTPGKTVAVSADKQINDYQLVGNSTQSATFGETPSVDFTYEKKDSFEAYQSTITVYYLDEQGQTLDTEIINRTVTQAGQMEVLSAKVFTGYSLISNNTQQVALDGAVKAITFTYRKDVPVAAPSTSGNAIVNEAYKYLGIPYVWGGRDTNGFDCSGLTRYVYQMVTGREIGYNTVAQESAGTQISVSQAQAGDLLFWGDKGATYHVAIYIGNNQAIHAPQPGEKVSVFNLNYFKPDFAVRVN